MLRHPALRAALAVVLVLGVGYTLWRSWNDPTLADYQWQFHPLPVGIAFLLMVCTSISTAPLWLIIYRGLGGNVSTLDGCRIFLVTNIGKYLPGKVMHAAGRVALLSERGQPASIGVTSVLVELALSLLGAALVSVISIPILLRGQGIAEHLELIGWVSWLALPAGLIGLHPRVMGPILRFASKKLPGKNTELCTDLPPYRVIILLLAGYVVLWVTMSIGLFATAHTVVGWETLSWADLPAVSGIAALSYLFGLAVPIAPAGLGAREGLMTVLLTAIGMPAPAAAVTSILYRIVSVSAELASAGLSAVLARGR
ncbi:MAG: flippase-like domain-containing protein [Chloroflexi bacterium]|nr:flippase-like domain-containing protein [Chloroflexota bacterium]